MADGSAVGAADGAADGSKVGSADGVAGFSEVGRMVGWTDGSSASFVGRIVVGCNEFGEGNVDAIFDGTKVVAIVAFAVGAFVGQELGGIQLQLQ